MVCGGLEKRVVFKEAIMPVLRTMCGQLQCDIKDYVQKLISIMFGGEDITESAASVATANR